ncbi:hypothetical protein N7462_004137 [Penicillium macrosclerotiorum]|uniref:uncharacterized protein n=1 Tax=Penicillium macrosclerotiorum TaxID=303699 RepID=UPI002546CE1D|nr:uncharacterized protein N7462_004137 [Penicillium macrosclerotiorum]KAJ5689745.1 hypothetical protein N7462_004137 [Penicillium macrosclerotiorum]
MAYFFKLVKEELPSILEGLTDKAEGSWLHELSGMSSEVLDLLGTSVCEIEYRRLYSNAGRVPSRRIRRGL